VVLKCIPPFLPGLLAISLSLTTRHANVSLSYLALNSAATKNKKSRE
jgi:hypothetical protein